MPVQNLNGLNSLRFFAAFLVLLYHVDGFLRHSGFHFAFHPAFLDKGYPAVSFFFSLSGFLITYLLLQEQAEKGKIHIRNFYIRRILRIWPLYFLIVITGLFLFYGVVPFFHPEGKPLPSLLPVSILFLFFLPNLVNNLFPVGGALNITWSIGIEEQFYLVWAPVMRLFRKRQLWIMVMVFIFSFLLMAANIYNLFHLDENLRNFLYTYQFHYLAGGGIFAWMVSKYRTEMLKSLFFRSVLMQWILFALIFAYFFIYPSGNKNVVLFLVTELLLCLLFPWLIVNISLNPLNKIRIRNRFFENLGNISYGIYMYHMIIIAIAGYFAGKAGWIGPLRTGGAWIFYTVVIVGTIVVSYLSYEYFERRFLGLKKRFA